MFPERAGNAHPPSLGWVRKRCPALKINGLNEAPTPHSHFGSIRVYLLAPFCATSTSSMPAASQEFDTYSQPRISDQGPRQLASKGSPRSLADLGIDDDDSCGPNWPGNTEGGDRESAARPDHGKLKDRAPITEERADGEWWEFWTPSDWQNRDASGWSASSRLHPTSPSANHSERKVADLIKELSKAYLSNSAYQPDGGASTNSLATKFEMDL
jgi:hypothetical protein